MVLLEFDVTCDKDTLLSCRGVETLPDLASLIHDLVSSLATADVPLPGCGAAWRATLDGCRTALPASTNQVDSTDCDLSSVQYTVYLTADQVSSTDCTRWTIRCAVHIVPYCRSCEQYRLHQVDYQVCGTQFTSQPTM